MKTQKDKGATGERCRNGNGYWSLLNALASQIDHLAAPECPVAEESSFVWSFGSSLP